MISVVGSHDLGGDHMISWRNHMISVVGSHDLGGGIT